MKPLRILYVSEYYAPKIGGGENWLRQLATEMVSRGHEVHVVTSRLPATTEHEIIDGVHIHRPFPTGGFLRRVMLMRRLKPYLVTFIKEHQIDVIHSNAYIPTPPASAAGKICGIPVITSVHLGLGKTWFKVTNPLSAAVNYVFEDLIVRFSHHDVLHVTAQATKRQFERKTRAPVTVLYNFVDKPMFENAYRKLDVTAIRKRYKVHGKFLLSVGSLLPVKNLRQAIDWVQSLDDDVTFLIAGNGPEKRALERAIARHKEKDIRLIGSLSDDRKLELFGACDAFILVSKSEQFPLTVLEAIAFNRTVIAAPVGGIPDIARAGFSQRISFVSSKREFSRAISRLRQRAPSIDKKIFNVYDKRKVADGFLKLYERRQPLRRLGKDRRTTRS